MKVIGLTGNIGCGKSTVAGMLRDLGVAIIDADAVARQVRNNDGVARRRIEERFGTLEAGELARIVFTDPAALPTSRRSCIRRSATRSRARLAELVAAGAEAACIEAIKLLESPLLDGCDRSGWCAATRRMRWRRLAASRGMDEEAARARLANQTSQAEKVAAADVGDRWLGADRRRRGARWSDALRGDGG